MSRLAALLIAVMAVPAGVTADQRLPVFDTHVHYSRAVWAVHDPAAALVALRAAGVTRALVSSTPDDGTLALYRLDATMVVPVLRPYRRDIGAGNWFRDPGLITYLEARLDQGVHRGIGEVHLFDAALAPAVRALARLAAARHLILHLH